MSQNNKHRLMAPCDASYVTEHKTVHSSSANTMEAGEGKLTLKTELFTGAQKFHTTEVLQA